MRTGRETEQTAGPPYVSTGHLPAPELARSLVAEAYARLGTVDEGTVADYIPALARAAPSLFGICVAGVNGALHSAGDAGHAFSIQSISKPFVFALVAHAIGAEAARERIGVNATALSFNSVMAVELNASRTMNPMVNAGVIATTSLAPGASADAKWAFLDEGLSRFAGRALTLDAGVYRSEAATNLRNRGVAKLLEGYGRMYLDALEATDIYTRRCSLNVTAKDLAVMGPTLAGGGVNPISGERAIEAPFGKRVLAALATADRAAARRNRTQDPRGAGDARDDRAGVHAHLRIPGFGDRPLAAPSYSGRVSFWPQGPVAAWLFAQSSRRGSASTRGIRGLSVTASWPRGMPGVP
ncbi:MAG: glutaminase [Acetobacteraceae bacterium]